MINVIPEGSPSSDATSELVDEVRASVIPKSGVDAHVGGSTAQLLDLADLIGKRLPLIIAVVVALSMLLLLVAFRSVVAPLQAALVNLLSVGAAYGILTAVFQEGHGATAIGLDGAIPIVSYVPMMMFAILFGLAMDYQVFLLSRVREEVDAGKSPRQAVIAGLAGTGKVIASAAAIMVAVFASFILNGDPTVKEFGVGLASAIFIAGAMVCVLLPAVMLLMGRRTWWLPRRLDRVLPHISVEGEPAPSPTRPRARPPQPAPERFLPHHPRPPTGGVRRCPVPQQEIGRRHLAGVLAAVLTIAVWPASEADKACDDGEQLGQAVARSTPPTAPRRSTPRWPTSTTAVADTARPRRRPGRRAALRHRGRARPRGRRLRRRPHLRRRLGRRPLPGRARHRHRRPRRPGRRTSARTPRRSSRPSGTASTPP